MSVFADYIFYIPGLRRAGHRLQVNNPSVGITYAFNPTLIGTAQVGYFWQNPERFTGSPVSQQPEHHTKGRQTTYTLIIYSGYQQDHFGFVNMGFNTIFGGSAVISHNVTQRFNVGFIGTAMNTDYAFRDRNDWLYTADATASYQLLRWLTLSGRVGYQQNDSNIEVNSYDEWHVFLTSRPRLIICCIREVEEWQVTAAAQSGKSDRQDERNADKISLANENSEPQQLKITKFRRTRCLEEV